jgi:hypothetical protein
VSVCINRGSNMRPAGYLQSPASVFAIPLGRRVHDSESQCGSLGTKINPFLMPDIETRYLDHKHVAA